MKSTTKWIVAAAAINAVFLPFTVKSTVRIAGPSEASRQRLMNCCEESAPGESYCCIRCCWISLGCWGSCQATRASRASDDLVDAGYLFVPSENDRWLSTHTDATRLVLRWAGSPGHQADQVSLFPDDHNCRADHRHRCQKTIHHAPTLTALVHYRHEYSAHKDAESSHPPPDKGEVS